VKRELRSCIDNYLASNIINVTNYYCILSLVVCTLLFIATDIKVGKSYLACMSYDLAGMSTGGHLS
jgi:hypothetical protein